MYKNQDKKPYKLKLVNIDVYNYEKERLSFLVSTGKFDQYFW